VGRGGNNVAREWRVRWRIASDTGCPLFDRPVSEWNKNQVRFAYWMQFYDMVYQSEDCPEEHIIADNELIDKWFEGKIKEQEARRTGAIRGRRGMSSGMSAFDHQSVTVY
jgi:hypothetical protein